MIRGITYSDDQMDISKHRCMDSMLKHGVDDVRGYDSSWWGHWQGEDTFSWLNKSTLEKERGSGYWLWKPWCIAHSFSQLKDGDILMYSDAGVELIAPVQEIISRMDEDIFFFTNGFPHVEWCKGDVFMSVLNWDMSIDFNSDLAISQRSRLDAMREYKQVQASVIFFKVNQKTRDFVKEWLLWCQMPGFIDDSPSKTPNYPTFAEHRHDQAVLTCCAIKHGYTTDHWWPTQYSNHLPRSERDSYPVMFNHHRKRNVEWLEFTK